MKKNRLNKGMKIANVGRRRSRGSSASLGKARFGFNKARAEYRQKHGLVVKIRDVAKFLGL